MFLFTFLSCSNWFLRALQQNKAQSRLLYNLNKIYQNSPVQFCPFPVYPSWQLHTCDPMVLVQFAFSWQEWFPVHSSTSMRSEIKKWDFKIMQKLPCISHYRIKDCKSCLFSTRDCHTWRKLNILVNKNLKTFKTIDGTCTISPISDISRFACAHVWSVCVITPSLIVAFSRGCYAFINICRKIRKKHRKKKLSIKVISISVSFKEP